jgi:hypothetical protein
MEGLDFLATDPEARRVAAKATMKIQGGAAIGALVGAAALAIAWKSHRVWGGLLGLFIAGPAVGGTVGYVTAFPDIKRLAEISAARKSLPVSGAALQGGDRVRGRDIFGKTQTGVVATDEANYTGTGSGQVFVKWADGSSSSAKIADLVRA